MPELLIGCGNARRKIITFDEIPDQWTELITLDIDPNCKPTYEHDLTNLPLPFDDNSFDEIHAYEVLEHTGQQGDWRFFFNQFYEFWRILKPNGYFCATVPAWDAKWSWGDPGHTRIINEGTLLFLSQLEYEANIGKTTMTDYRHWWKGDFAPIVHNYEGETMAFVLQAIKNADESVLSPVLSISGSAE